MAAPASPQQPRPTRLPAYKSGVYLLTTQFPRLIGERCSRSGWSRSAGRPEPGPYFVDRPAPPSPGRRSLTSTSRRSRAVARRRTSSPATRHGASPPTSPSCRCCWVRPKRVYSITLSARTNNASGTVTPIALAVLRLITSSNLVGCSTGMSASKRVAVSSPLVGRVQPQSTYRRRTGRRDPSRWKQASVSSATRGGAKRRVAGIHLAGAFSSASSAYSSVSPRAQRRRSESATKRSTTSAVALIFSCTLRPVRR